MTINNPTTSELKLFEFGTKKKLILLICTAILWIATLITFFTSGFDHWLLASFNSLRTDALFAGFWYYYTVYALYIVLFPLLILYLLSFKVDKLKSYRLVIFLSVLTTAIGTPIVDPILKDFFAILRPWAAYSDINSLYYVSGFSFPSGHSFQSFAITLPLIICFLTNDNIFKRNWKKIFLAMILLIFAITLAFSRVLAGVHYFSDVLAGVGFAIILMVVLASLLQWLLSTGKLNLQNEKWYALVFILILIMNTMFIR